MVHHSKPGRGKFSIEHVAGSGYYVFNPDRARVSGPYGCKSKALTARDRQQFNADMEHKRKERPCMTCQRTFVSDGPHNRMCSHCRNLGDDTLAHSFINPRRRTG